MIAGTASTTRLRYADVEDAIAGTGPMPLDLGRQAIDRAYESQDGEIWRTRLDGARTIFEGREEVALRPSHVEAEETSRQRISQWLQTRAGPNLEVDIDVVGCERLVPGLGHAVCRTNSVCWIRWSHEMPERSIGRGRVPRRSGGTFQQTQVELSRGFGSYGGIGYPDRQTWVTPSGGIAVGASNGECWGEIEAVAGAPRLRIGTIEGSRADVCAAGMRGMVRGSGWDCS